MNPIENLKKLGLKLPDVSTKDEFKAMELCALNVLAQVDEKIGFDKIIGLNHIDAYFQSGADWLKHNGGTGGYSSVIIINTAKKNGIIILSYVSSFNSKSSYIDKLSFELMKNIE